MGEERAWKRKHLFFCLACCLILLPTIAGCMYPVKQWQGRQDLRQAELLMESGAFEDSMDESLKVLKEHPMTLGAEAFFQMGLLYAHPENPRADHGLAVASFERILREYPLSRRKEEARLWLLTLNSKGEEVQMLQGKVNLLEEAAQERENRLALMEGEIKERDERLREAENKLEAKEKALMEAQNMLDQINIRVAELEAQLAKFKDVDLTIEQKRRTTVP